MQPVNSEIPDLMYRAAQSLGQLLEIYRLNESDFASGEERAQVARATHVRRQLIEAELGLRGCK